MRVERTECFKRIQRAARKAGWKVTRSKNNHIKLIAPCGYTDFHSSSPGDWRAEKNWVARLRRKGLQI